MYDFLQDFQILQEFSQDSMFLHHFYEICKKNPEKSRNLIKILYSGGGG